MLNAVIDVETEAALEIIGHHCPAGFFVVINLASGPEGTLNPTPDFLRYTYMAEWVTHYARENLTLDDPTINFAHGNTGYVSWADLKESFPESRTLTEAERFGLTDGNTLVMDIDGVKSVVSGAGKLWTTRDQRDIRAALAAIHLRHVKSPQI